MLILNSKGERVDPSQVDFSIYDFDSIYGGMTVGKTTLANHLLKTGVKYVDSDWLWQLLFPCDRIGKIWELKRNSPEVDAAMSGVVRMIAIDLTLSEGTILISNMGIPLGDSIKVVRPGEDTYAHMVARNRKSGKAIKISKSQVLQWSETWMTFDPRFTWTVILDSDEYLADVFGVSFTARDFEIDEATMFIKHRDLFTKRYGAAVNGIPSPFIVKGHIENFNQLIDRLRKERGYA